MNIGLIILAVLVANGMTIAFAYLVRRLDRQPDAFGMIAMLALCGLLLAISLSASQGVD